MTKCKVCENEIEGQPYATELYLGSWCSRECREETLRIRERNEMAFRSIKHGFCLVDGSDKWKDPIYLSGVTLKYYLKDSVIDAIQYTNVGEGSVSFIADFLGRNYSGCYNNGIQQYILLVSNVGSRVLREGDWVIKKDGSYDVLSDDRFQTLYTKI